MKSKGRAKERLMSDVQRGGIYESKNVAMAIEAYIRKLRADVEAEKAETRRWHSEAMRLRKKLARLEDGK